MIYFSRRNKLQSVIYGMLYIRVNYKYSKCVTCVLFLFLCDPS
ncbi:hypothetical protein VAEU17_4360028 [Vibrio aestuarianus]|nr:hypothetical protein VAEU17_4360028 [Vibrio aestuarianus]